MQFKPLAALLISAALCMTTEITAQTTTTTSSSTTVKPAGDKSADPATLSWKKNKKAAKKLIKAGKVEEATPYLEAGAKKNPKKIYFADNLTRVEIAQRNYKASNEWHKVMMDKDSAKHKKPEYIFGYALTQKYLGQYEEAKVNFARFKKLAGESDELSELKKRATREILGCDRGIYYRDSVSKRDFKVKHLDANINQSSSNFGPMAKDNALYFNSIKAGNDAIYKSIKSGKSFSVATDLPSSVNIDANITAPAFSADGNTMYYTMCPKDKGEKVMPKCEIYKSVMVNGTWDKGASAGSLLNDGTSNNKQPAVGKNKDGEDVLYFSSDRNTGKGWDLFYGKINPDGSVGKPRSVGSMINSKGDETTPFYDVKSKILYFSSNGLISIGGLDVFRTTWDANGDWIEPENMGTPVNSSVDDYYFSINDRGYLGYEASNRVGGSTLKCETCSDDIYMVETTKLFLAVTGLVYEEKDSQRVTTTQGAVSLYDDRNGTDLGSYTLNSSGTYFFDLEPKRGYKVLTRRDGYYDGVSTFNTDNNTESDTMKYDLFLKRRIVEDPLIGRIIGRIYYDYDQARLRSDSRDSLRKILDIMQQFPKYAFEVGAHTDGKGTEAYNLALSKRRAEAAMGYFNYEKKISKDRLIIKAYGTDPPVAAPNQTPEGKDSPEGRALNRRTEFKILYEIKAGSTPPADVAPAKTEPVKIEKKAEPVKAEKKAEPVKAEKKAEPVKIKKDVAPAKETKKEEPKKTTEAPVPTQPADAAPAKVVKKDLTTGKTIDETKPAAATTTKTAPAKATTTTKTTAPAKSTTTTTTSSAKVAPPTTAKKDEAPVYKPAPTQTVTLTGKVYTERGGKRLISSEASVFLTSDQAGFEQKVFYVRGDGSYSFDLSRSAPGTIYKVIARKDKFESNEISMSVEHIKAINSPIDLVIETK